MPRATTHCSAPVDDKSGAGGLLPGEIPGILCAHGEPIARCPVDCRFPLVILQQAAQSFSTPHCSRVPSYLRLRRKQDPITFALMVAYDIFHRAAWTPWDDPPCGWHELRSHRLRFSPATPNDRLWFPGDLRQLVYLGTQTTVAVEIASAAKTNKRQEFGAVGARALERSTSWSSTGRSPAIRVPVNYWF